MNKFNQITNFDHYDKFPLLRPLLFAVYFEIKQTLILDTRLID